MQDLLLSLKQYQALLNRLDHITDDVTLIRLKSNKEALFIDSYELAKFLHVTPRSVQRWCKTGRLPFIRMGKKYYFQADKLIDSFKVLPPNLCENVSAVPDLSESSAEEDENALCLRCPLYLILNS